MKKSPPNISFFSVCTFEKSRFIPKNYNAIKKFYKNSKYSVVVPIHQVEIFKKFFKAQGIGEINLISEDKYISLTAFKEIYLEKSKENNIEFENHSTKRLGWYYQQVLKLSFVYEECELINKVVMIDADTIILKKIKFFDKGKSVISFSKYEKNHFYLESSEYIFKRKVKSWQSSTVQTFAITDQELKKLNYRLCNFLSPSEFKKRPYWISNLILGTVIEKYKTIEGSLFSEQDLIAISNGFDNPSNKVERIFIRSNVPGLLKTKQAKIASLLGYQYVTYEDYFLKKSKCNYIDFIFVLIVNQPSIYRLSKAIKKFLNL